MSGAETVDDRADSVGAAAPEFTALSAVKAFTHHVRYHVGELAARPASQPPA